MKELKEYFDNNKDSTQIQKMLNEGLISPEEAKFFYALMSKNELFANDLLIYAMSKLNKKKQPPKKVSSQ